MTDKPTPAEKPADKGPDKATPAKTAGKPPVATQEQPPADSSVDGRADGVDTDAPADVVGTDDTPAQPDGTPPRLEGVDAAVAPYPLYEDLKLEELRSLAEGRDVTVNADVEKALLVKALRDHDTEQGPERVGPAQDDSGDNRYASYDLMPLDALRDLARGRDVGLDPVDEKSHLVTELRAADSGA